MPACSQEWYDGQSAGFRGRLEKRVKAGAHGKSSQGHLALIFGVNDATPDRW